MACPMCSTCPTCPTCPRTLRALRTHVPKYTLQTGKLKNLFLKFNFGPFLVELTGEKFPNTVFLLQETYFL